jgi:hypothetical protein
MVINKQIKKFIQKLVTQSESFAKLTEQAIRQKTLLFCLTDAVPKKLGPVLSKITDSLGTGCLFTTHNFLRRLRMRLVSYSVCP